MSEAEDREGAATDVAAEPGPPPTPFDHPLFLPVLLIAFCAWFGYDAYLNRDPDMLEHLGFNRFGLRVMLYFALFFSVEGWAELREKRGHPLLPAALLAGMSLWFAYDGFISQDPFNVENAAFDRETSAVLAALAAVGAYTGFRRLGGAEPLWVSPAGLLAAAGWYGFRMGDSGDDLILYLSACAGFGVLGLWLGGRRFRDRRRQAREA